MQENVGGTERVVRALVGPSLVAWGLTILGPARRKLGPVALIVAGALVTETVITKTCPLSEVLGLNTAETPSRAMTPADADRR